MRIAEVFGRRFQIAGGRCGTTSLREYRQLLNQCPCLDAPSFARFLAHIPPFDEFPRPISEFFGGNGISRFNGGPARFVQDFRQFLNGNNQLSHVTLSFQ